MSRDEVFEETLRNKIFFLANNSLETRQLDTAENLKSMKSKKPSGKKVSSGGLKTMSKLFERQLEVGVTYEAMIQLNQLWH